MSDVQQKSKEKKSRNELTNSLRNVDAEMAMLLRIGLMRRSGLRPESAIQVQFNRAE